MDISGVSSSQIDQYKYAAKQAEAQVSSSQEADAQEGSERAAAKPAASGGESASAQAANSSQSASAAAATLSTVSDSDSESDAAYQAIVSKANSGQELTSSELSTLRTKDAALYAKAVRAQQAREELRNQMEANPSNAAQSAHNAVSTVSGDSSKAADEDAQVITRRALNDEYRNFASKYDQVTISRQMTQDIASAGKNIV